MVEKRRGWTRRRGKLETKGRRRREREQVDGEVLEVEGIEVAEESRATRDVKEWDVERWRSL